jgi:tetratricopeptide (TPR) repeat protein
MLFDGLAGRYRRAQVSFELRDYTTAADELESVLEEAPDNVAARLLLARAYYHSARLGPAERTLRDVLERAPGDAYAYLLLGRTLQRQGRHDEAAGPLRLAATMNPDLATDELGVASTSRPRDGASPTFVDLDP